MDLARRQLLLDIVSEQGCYCPMGTIPQELTDHVCLQGLAEEALRSLERLEKSIANSWPCSHRVTIDDADGSRSCLTCGTSYARADYLAKLRELCKRRWEIDFKRVHRTLSQEEEEEEDAS